MKRAPARSEDTAPIAEPARRSKKRRPSRFSLAMERFSRTVTDATGTTAAQFVSVALILVWLLSGPLFKFSDTWQLVINTGTTIITFLMVFLIQRSQNKDARAMSAKLNELIAAMEGASNRLIEVETLSEDEIAAIHRHYQHLAKLAKRDSSITASHSIEEAEERHRRKKPKAAKS
jgi:low affinity Fe/Cu permease